MKTKLFLNVFVVISLSQGAIGAMDKVIASFEDANSTANWISVNDGVMGGVSEGTFERTDRKTLRFYGKLSLENRGGFASIRARLGDTDLTGATGVVIEAKGDGRRYWVDLRTGRQMAASSFRAYLPTTKGKWQETFIPFKDFNLQAFGRQLSEASVDPAAISSVGFTLADKKAGPFELEIESIRAVSKASTAAVSSEGGSIVATLDDAGKFKTLLAAATAAGLADVLASQGPFTVFAPTDKAFAQLPGETVENLLKPENKEKLADILKYHVLAGRVTLAQALIKAGNTKTDVDRAWALRYALDRFLRNASM